MDKKMTADEVKKLIKKRGYNNQTEVANFFGVSRTHITRIIADENRSKVWELALNGLPNK